RQIEQIGNFRTACRTLWSSESFREIQARLNSRQFDILHVQNFFPLWSPAVYYAASKCGVPVVQTLRNYRLICVNATMFLDHKACDDCLGHALPWPGIIHRCYRDSHAGSAVVASMIGLHKMLSTWKNKVQIYIALTEFA